MRANRDVSGAWYLERSYESYLIYWLNELDQHCRVAGLPYALFGGAAVGAYVGHLPRRLHDLDVLVLPSDVQTLAAFFLSRGFKERPSIKSEHAGFKKLVKRDELYEMIITVFPGRFTLLDVDQPDLPLVGHYNLVPAIERRIQRQIRALGDSRIAQVQAIPLEDLIISKLWPTFEPTTVHDLMLLLCCPEAETLDTDYLETRVTHSGPLRWLSLQTLDKFESIYRNSAWYRLASSQETCERILGLLRSNLHAESGNRRLQ